MLASLLFAPGHRPAVEAIEALCADATIAILHRPGAEPGQAAPNWIELIATGLTFDLHGLAPGPAAERPTFTLRHDLSDDIDSAEGITLALGPHLSGAGNLPPVLRAAAGVTVALCGLPGVVAIGWHPINFLMTPALFAVTVEAWLVADGTAALDETGRT